VPAAPETSKVPIAPMGDSRVARCLQGGGVYVNSGTVAITSSSIYGNTRVNGVRAHIYDFPSPMGDSRFAHCLQGGGVYVASGTVTITSSTIYGNTVNGVRTHARKYPSPPWKTHVLLAVCRAAVSLLGEAQWPSHRAPSVGTQLAKCALMLKISHRPMGKLLMRLPRLTLAQLRPALWSTAVGMCRRDLKFPIAPMGIC
jgi:hypothetical protein